MRCSDASVAPRLHCPHFVGVVAFGDAKRDPYARIAGGQLGVISYSCSEDMETALETLDGGTLAGAPPCERAHMHMHAGCNATLPMPRPWRVDACTLARPATALALTTGYAGRPVRVVRETPETKFEDLVGLRTATAAASGGSRDAFTGNLGTDAGWTGGADSSHATTAVTTTNEAAASVSAADRGVDDVVGRQSDVPGTVDDGIDARSGDAGVREPGAVREGSSLGAGVHCSSSSSSSAVALSSMQPAFAADHSSAMTTIGQWRDVSAGNAVDAGEQPASVVRRDDEAPVRTSDPAAGVDAPSSTLAAVPGDSSGSSVPADPRRRKRYVPHWATAPSPVMPTGSSGSGAATPGVTPSAVL